MPSSIILDLPRTPRAPGQARDALHTLPALHRSLLGDAQLLVSELVTHGGRHPAAVACCRVDRPPPAGDRQH